MLRSRDFLWRKLARVTTRYFRLFFQIVRLYEVTGV